MFQYPSQQNSIEHLLSVPEGFPPCHIPFELPDNPFSVLSHVLPSSKSEPTLRNTSHDITFNGPKSYRSGDSTSKTSHQSQHTSSSSRTTESRIPTEQSCSSDLNGSSALTAHLQVSSACHHRSPMLDRFLSVGNPRDEAFPLFARMSMEERHG